MEVVPVKSDGPMSLLGRLRSATHAGHERAETLVGLPQSLAFHIETLATFYGLIEPWEAAIEKVLAPLNNELQGRQKTQLLSNDLKSLDVSKSAIATLSRCHDLPSFDSVPAALGSMYVFEGATLGGQVLSRHIEKHLGLSHGDGYSFYRSYGPRVGSMWRECGEILNRNVAEADADAAIKSAVDTFQCLCDWFERQRTANQRRVAE